MTVETPAIANPIRFSDTRITYGKATPLLGEHTTTVLEQIGLTASRIAALREKGVL